MRQRNRPSKLSWIGFISLSLCALISLHTQSIAKELYTIAIAPNYAPYTIVTPQGNPAGLTVDLWKLWAESEGVEIEFKVLPWPETLKQASEGKIDIHSGMFHNAQREKLFDFSSPIAHIPSAFYSRYDNDLINSTSDLKGKRVSVIEGTFQENYIHNQVPEAIAVPLPDIKAVSAALIDGTSDVAFAETPAMISELVATGFSGLVQTPTPPIMANHLLGGVKKGNAELLEKIENGLAHINIKKAIDAEKRWLTNPADRYFEQQHSSIRLSDEESNWLQKHGQIRVGVTTFINPVDIITSEGEYSGLNADLLKEISKVLGVQMTPERFDTWPDMINSAIGGKIDAVMNVSKTPDRLKVLNFTRPYAYDPIIAVTRKDHDSVNDWGALKGERVSALENSAMFDDVASFLGKENVIAVTSDDEGLLAVKNGDIDAHVTGLILFRNAQDKLDLSGLRMAGSKNVEGGALRIGAHKQVPFLANIIQKAINTIPQKRMREIRSKWLLGEREEKKFDALDYLSTAERSWLKKNPKIRVHNEMEWAPFNFFDQGKPHGYSIDIMNLIGKKIGLDIEYTSGPSWSNFLDMMNSKTLDVMLNIVETPERQKYIEFTAPYIENNPAIAINESVKGISDLESLQGRKVCIPSGFYYEELLKRDHPGITLISRTNSPLCLQAISIGEADATIENAPVLNHVLRKTLISNIKIAGIIDDPKFTDRLRIGVRKDWPILRDILDKMLATLSEEELTPIRAKWFGNAHSDMRQLGITQTEAAWLRRNSNIRLGIDPSWAPFEFVNKDGKYSGISSDFIKEIAKRINIRATPTMGLSWTKVLDGIADGSLDVIPLATHTPEREKTMLFTNPYISFPIVLATKIDADYISGLDGLANKSLAVVNNYVAHETVKRDYPHIPLIPTESLEEAIRLVREGKAFAAIGNLAAITYLMNTQEYHDIKIAAPTGQTSHLSMAVRKDWPELVPILNKALDSFTEVEKNTIKNRWIAVSYEFGLDYLTIFFWAFPVVLGLGVIIIVIVIWNRRLGAEVTERQKAEDRARERETWFKSLLESMPDATIISNPQGIIHLINKQTELLFGYDRDELIGQKVDILVPDDTRPNHDKLREGYVDNPHVRHMGKGKELFARHKDGTTFPVEISLSPIQSSEGIHVAASVRDITERRSADRKLEFTQNAVDHASDPIFWVNPETGGFEYVNVSAWRTLGYERNELLKMGIIDIDVNFDAAKLADLIERVKEEKFANFESQLLNSIGLFIDVEVTVYPAEYGDRTLLIANVKDITLRKKAEAEIKEQEERIRLLIESVGEGIIGVDQVGHVSFINQVACKTLGYTSDELIGRKVHGIIHHSRPDGSDYPLETCPMWKAYTFGQAARIDDEVLWTKEGIPVDVEYHATPLMKNDDVVGAVIAFRDISEMVTLNRDFVSLLENSTDYIYFKDLENRYVMVSQAMADMNGFTNRQDMVGKKLEDIYDSEYANDIYEQEVPLLSGDIPVLEQVQQHKGQNGNDRWGDVRKYPLRDSAGNITGLVGMSRDITQRIEAEEKLEAAFDVISQSINYASRIQRSVLPPAGFMDRLFDDHFIIWEPRDIVGGDIYWCQPWEQGMLIALCDCTGHGVPGAFMTLIANGALEIALNSTEAGDCATLISNMNIRIKTVLSQDRDETLSDDGLEIAVCYITPEMDTIHFAGARMSMMIKEKDEITELKGDRSSIGYKAIGYDAQFTNHVINATGKQFYLLSDGIVDQPGGNKRCGFGKKRFKKILTEISNVPLIEQRTIIYDEFKRYEGTEIRRDDVSVIGFSL